MQLTYTKTTSKMGLVTKIFLAQANPHLKILDLPL